LHGGGNTSVKTRINDVMGAPLDVLCVKGSGWDMGVIEPRGLPALRLDALLPLRRLAKLTDEDMVNFQRGCLLDATSPNPSVETLLHAFLPHKFIDHTHANAVLALSDQPDGEAKCRDLYGERVALVPYVMPGFGLAKITADFFDRDPRVEGIVLLKHGIFSFGASAREAYDRMIRLVDMAEKRLAQGKKTVVAVPGLPAQTLPVEEIAPILRGAVAEMIDANEGTWRRSIFDFRTGEAIRALVDAAEIGRMSGAGCVTPDHVIRTKAKPLIAPAPKAGDREGFIKGVKAAVEAYKKDYQAYFERQNKRVGGTKKALDPYPRVVLVPGVGLFGLGKSAKDAAIAADIATTAAETIVATERFGTFQPVGEDDLFDVEYWSLEQAKLGQGGEKPLARQVVVVTGGGGGIGAATATAFAAEGAEVVVLDRDGAAAEAVAKKFGGAGLACDVTKREEVDAAFAFAARRYGGVDVVVSNAGAAWQGRIGEVADKVLRESFELNFFAHQHVAQAAMRVFKAQGIGGCLLFNVSKQAVNPGLDFGPYGLPKAALLFLSRQYAVDHGAEGIRSNAVNADRINTGIFAGGLLEERAKARGLTVAQYLSQGNLLQREVKAADVAQAFVTLARANKTTGAVLTVDGGNIAAALR
ncbi:MAG: bifunctional aldolase/short-chain dehydrogenase, partial [Alphaproteobacteria bacterium]|nr:bifunctional aldolase/short-chain dehydrogenase [Alphaproteobacteria bacterium]